MGPSLLLYMERSQVYWQSVFLFNYLQDHFKIKNIIYKVVYVTALLPYVIILIFLVRGVTLDGAWIGLEFFFIPKWEKLGEVKVIKLKTLIKIK